MQGVDRRLLNLAGAAQGVDFGSTTINSTNEITLTKSGTVTAATGCFNAGKFQVTRAGQTPTMLDFSADYAVTVDNTAQTALLRELTLSDKQNGRPQLGARLSQPMNLAWGNSVSGVGDSALSAILKSPVNVIATIPQMLSNPASAIVSIFNLATGQGGGLVDELQKAPIEIIAVRGQAGNGRTNLQQATVQSTGFEADAPGEIVLAPVLTNSTINFPVTVSVNQSIAKQLNLTAANSAAGASHVQMPQFFTMTGTPGDPQKQFNKTALVGLTVKSVTGGLLNHATNAVSPFGNLLNQLLKRAP